MRTTLPIKNGDLLQTLRSWLGDLLRAGLVDLLYVPMRTRPGMVAPAAVSNPELLDWADPLAPVMPVNGAVQVGKLTKREPAPRVGAVLRPCESRALIELIKLKQAGRENLVLISVDCAGTMPVPDFMAAKATERESAWRDFYASVSNSSQDSKTKPRAACQICGQPAHDDADIVVELFGAETPDALSLSIKEEWAEKLGMAPAEGKNGNREEILSKLIEKRTAARQAALQGIGGRLKGTEGLTDVFASCIGCHNCMTACPVCHCKTCVFKSPVFDHEPMRYLTWARQKGACRMPSDGMLFHLTRLNHMVLSCVGCGMCTEACPSRLPVGEVFQTVGERVQAVFDYLPGRSVEEKPPLITFKADEWSEVGEEV